MSKEEKEEKEEKKEEEEEWDFNFNWVCFQKDLEMRRVSALIDENEDDMEDC